MVLPTSSINFLSVNRSRLIFRLTRSIIIQGSFTFSKFFPSEVICGGEPKTMVCSSYLLGV